MLRGSVDENEAVKPKESLRVLDTQGFLNDVVVHGNGCLTSLNPTSLAEEAFHAGTISPLVWGVPHPGGRLSHTCLCLRVKLVASAREGLWCQGHVQASPSGLPAPVWSSCSIYSAPLRVGTVNGCQEPAFACSHQGVVRGCLLMLMLPWKTHVVPI